MLTQAGTILEVEQVSKLYSRFPVSTRQRLASVFSHHLLGRPSPPLDKLKKGEFWSLKDVSFKLERGNAIGIIGHNGAGKTTLLRILAGQILPDGGEIRIRGRTASMIDLTAGFQTTQSGAANIHLRGAMLGRSRQQIRASYDEIVEFAELDDAIDAPINSYSSGMTMRLAFSIMLASEPDILFIDEVLAVGDFRFRQKCLGKIRELRDRAAFVLVSHSMVDVKQFCNRAIVLDQGRIAFYGDPDEAVALYAEMQGDASNDTEASRDQRLRALLGAQFHNEAAISNVIHYWCDADGKEITQIRSGETLYFRVAYKMGHAARNLIMGVPLWRDDGTVVTGFSTEVSDRSFVVQAGEACEFLLEVPNLALNPGIYVSNLGITDGPEFLYRGRNKELVVLQAQDRFWGMVALPHSWLNLSKTEQGAQ